MGEPRENASIARRGALDTRFLPELDGLRPIDAHGRQIPGVASQRAIRPAPPTMIGNSNGNPTLRRMRLALFK